MISGSVVVPFQKGPCGDGVEEIRSFLLPLLEEAAAVVVLVLLFFLIFVCSVFVAAKVWGVSVRHSSLHFAAGPKALPAGGGEMGQPSFCRGEKSWGRLHTYWPTPTVASTGGVLKIMGKK